MTFEYTCIGNAGKLGIVQLLDITCTTVTHTSTQTTYQLEDYFIQSSFIRHAGSNAFGYQFLHIARAALEVAVFGTMFHRFQRAHAAV